MKEAFVFINVLTRMGCSLDLNILLLNALHKRRYHIRLLVHQSNKPHYMRQLKRELLCTVLM